MERPVARRRIAWRQGRLRLQVSAYTSLHVNLPDELVSSVRCLVRVEDRFVLCRNRDGQGHLVPGGHREKGETYAQTAIREVHEETGWLVRPATIRPLGWLHFEILSGPVDPALQYPDFLQAVVWGVADTRDGGTDADWTDTEGWETSSSLVSADEARTMSADELLDLVYLERILI